MKIVELSDIPGSVEIPLEHCPEWHMEEGEWMDMEFNYRLNNCDSIYYLLDEDDSFVGHIGLNDSKIQTVFISEEYQGQGLSYKLYEYLMEEFESFSSDDAREPAANHIWENLMKRYPGQVSYSKSRKRYIFEK